MHLDNIDDMHRAVEEGEGFDAIVVVSPTGKLANFWKDKLEKARGVLIADKTRIFSIEEDWEGGAGQLLGTLYAYKKLKAEIDDLLSKGGKVAIYHTAGEGRRLYPLTLAEALNKPAVKLPRIIETKHEGHFLTILEAVIFQTSIFASSREGRLCVFWGDQIFIPEKKTDFEGDCHAEIFDIRQEIPRDEETWRREWQNYGLIIPTTNGEVLQREKQTWEGIRKLMDAGLIKPDASGRLIVGKSLGSFSISHPFLRALFEEFSTELAQKHGKLDTDPHLWMPLTSKEEEFVAQGGDRSLWRRLNKFKKRFLAAEGGGKKLLKDKNLGDNTLWWDFGRTDLYYFNLLKLLEDSYEGECLRRFFGVGKHWIRSHDDDKLRIRNSVIVGCDISAGEVEGCVLFGVKADELKTYDSVIVNSLLSKADVKGALVYGCIDFEDMKLSSGEVVADTFLKRGRVRMYTELRRDGKRDWRIKLRKNYYSYEEMSKILAMEKG
ncbi:MAG: LbetaH domain-containing protein [Candidatus Methanospirareceae archaeon]